MGDKPAERVNFDLSYEFDAPRFRDFTLETSVLGADQWFDTSHNGLRHEMFSDAHEILPYMMGQNASPVPAPRPGVNTSMLSSRKKRRPSHLASRLSNEHHDSEDVVDTQGDENTAISSQQPPVSRRLDADFEEDAPDPKSRSSAHSLRPPLTMGSKFNTASSHGPTVSTTLPTPSAATTSAVSSIPAIKPTPFGTGSSNKTKPTDFANNITRPPSRRSIREVEASSSALSVAKDSTRKTPNRRSLRQNMEPEETPSTVLSKSLSSIHITDGRNSSNGNVTPATSTMAQRRPSRRPTLNSQSSHANNNNANNNPVSLDLTVGELEDDGTYESNGHTMSDYPMKALIEGKVTAPMVRLCDFLSPIPKIKTRTKNTTLTRSSERRRPSETINGKTISTNTNETKTMKNSVSTLEIETETDTGNTFGSLFSTARNAVMKFGTAAVAVAGSKTIDDDAPDGTITRQKRETTGMSDNIEQNVVPTTTRPQSRASNRTNTVNRPLSRREGNSQEPSVRPTSRLSSQQPALDNINNRPTSRLGENRSTISSISKPSIVETRSTSRTTSRRMAMTSATSTAGQVSRVRATSAHAAGVTSSIPENGAEVIIIDYDEEKSIVPTQRNPSRIRSRPISEDVSLQTSQSTRPNSRSASRDARAAGIPLHLAATASAASKTIYAHSPDSLYVPQSLAAALEKPSTVPLVAMKHTASSRARTHTSHNVQIDTLTSTTVNIPNQTSVSVPFSSTGVHLPRLNDYSHVESKVYTGLRPRTPHGTVMTSSRSMVKIGTVDLTHSSSTNTNGIKSTTELTNPQRIPRVALLAASRASVKSREIIEREQTQSQTTTSGMGLDHRPHARGSTTTTGISSRPLSRVSERSIRPSSSISERPSRPSSRTATSSALDRPVRPSSRAPASSTTTPVRRSRESLEHIHEGSGLEVSTESVVLRDETTQSGMMNGLTSAISSIFGTKTDKIDTTSHTNKTKSPSKKPKLTDVSKPTSSMSMNSNMNTNPNTTNPGLTLLRPGLRFSYADPSQISKIMGGTGEGKLSEKSIPSATRSSPRRATIMSRMSMSDSVDIPSTSGSVLGSVLGSASSPILLEVLPLDKAEKDSDLISSTKTTTTRLPARPTSASRGAARPPSSSLSIRQSSRPISQMSSRPQSTVSMTKASLGTKSNALPTVQRPSSALSSTNASIRKENMTMNSTQLSRRHQTKIDKVSYLPRLGDRPTSALSAVSRSSVSSTNKGDKKETKNLNSMTRITTTNSAVATHRVASGTDKNAKVTQKQSLKGVVVLPKRGPPKPLTVPMSPKITKSKKTSTK